MPNPLTPAQAALAAAHREVRLEAIADEIAALVRERDGLLAAKAAEAGFVPCADCDGGWCTMNCSSAPGYIKTAGWL